MKAESTGWVPQSLQALRTRGSNSYSLLPVPNTEWIKDRTQVGAEFEEPALGCVRAQDSAPYSSSAVSTGLCWFILTPHRLYSHHGDEPSGMIEGVQIKFIKGQTDP